MDIFSYLKCGKIIIFDSILAKGREAFCIDYSSEEEIIYRGFFGLKCVSKKVFLGFARIRDIFEYIDRPVINGEIIGLKLAYKKLSKNDFKQYRTVDEFVDAMYKEAKIKLFINNEDTKNAFKD